jgi:hypothetical protein
MAIKNINSESPVNKKIKNVFDNTPVDRAFAKMQKLGRFTPFAATGAILFCSAALAGCAPGQTQEQPTDTGNNNEIDPADALDAATLEDENVEENTTDIDEGIVDRESTDSNIIDEAVNVVKQGIPGTIAVGDVFSMGTSLDKPIEWLVLDVKEGKALVVSKNIWGMGWYHINFDSLERENATWETSSIRSELNDEVFFNMFNSDEQKRVLETKIINEDNPWYGTDGGNGTTDKLFLLSISEYLQYFPDDSGVAEIYDSKGYEFIKFSWWLRTPGMKSDRALKVSIDGRVSEVGQIVDNGDGGIRPAMWITL